MPNIDDDALSTVAAHPRASTSGDVDRALTCVSGDVRCPATSEDVTTEGGWRECLASFVSMLTGAAELTRMTDGNRVALWYFPQARRPA